MGQIVIEEALGARKPLKVDEQKHRLGKRWFEVIGVDIFKGLVDWVKNSIKYSWGTTREQKM